MRFKQWIAVAVVFSFAAPTIASAEESSEAAKSRSGGAFNEPAASGQTAGGSAVTARAGLKTLKAQYSGNSIPSDKKGRGAKVPAPAETGKSTGGGLGKLVARGSDVLGGAVMGTLGFVAGALFVATIAGPLLWAKVDQGSQDTGPMAGSAFNPFGESYGHSLGRQLASPLTWASKGYETGVNASQGLRDALNPKPETFFTP